MTPRGDQTADQAPGGVIDKALAKRAHTARGRGWLGQLRAVFAGPLFANPLFNGAATGAARGHTDRTRTARSLTDDAAALRDLDAGLEAVRENAPHAALRRLNDLLHAAGAAHTPPVIRAEDVRARGSRPERLARLEAARRVAGVHRPEA